jgi:hypothetical protein
MKGEDAGGARPRWPTRETHGIIQKPFTNHFEKFPGWPSREIHAKGCWRGSSIPAAAAKSVHVTQISAMKRRVVHANRKRQTGKVDEVVRAVMMSRCRGGR